MTNDKKLGRGFRILERDPLHRPHESSESQPAISTVTTVPAPEPGETVREIGLNQISPNPFQPRLNFDEAGMEELANSISAAGLMQPIILRSGAKGYEIIVGHRRFMAARRVGLSAIPAIVREVSDSGMLEMALLENIQRKDLDSVEKARAFERLETEFGLTHSEIGKRLGMNRSTVSNYIRLLELPAEILAHVSRGTLTMGHARALLAIEGNAARMTMCHKIIKEGMSVRETEENAAQASRSEGQPLRRTAKSAHLKEVEQTLQDRVGHRVTVLQTAKGAGKITIHFRATDDFNHIYERLTRAFEK